MGLFDRAKRAAVSKLDGPPEPPDHEWPADQAWARLIASEAQRGRNSFEGSSDPSIQADLAERATGISYRFELEVHRPEQATYVIERETRVPAKVEGALFRKATAVPAGAEVPLKVTGPGLEDFEFDWDAYLEIPHQADRTYHLHVKAGRANAAQRVSPELQAQSAQAMMMLAQGVVDGTVTRETFDEQAASLRELGYLSDEDHQAALAVIGV